METKADWLRTEIDKLEGMKKDTSGFPGQDEESRIGRIQIYAHNEALTTIITRYKEELLELEKGV